MYGPPKIVSECKRELKRIGERNAPHHQNGWSEPLVHDSCLLHHFVQEGDIDPHTGRPFPKTFARDGLSIVVTGFGFPALIVHREMIRLNRAGKKYVGAVAFKPTLFRDQLWYHLRYDPYPDPGPGAHMPPRNHGQIVCRKDTPQMVAMSDSCVWIVKPGENFIFSLFRQFFHQLKILLLD